MDATNCLTCTGKNRIAPACTQCVSGEYKAADSSNIKSDCVYQDFVHQFTMPGVAPYQVYSMRKLIPTYTGANVQVARKGDSALADIYMDS